MARTQKTQYAKHEIDKAIYERRRYAENFVAYAKERLKIKDRQSKTGGGLIPLELNPAQAVLHSMIEQWMQINLKHGGHGSKYPIKVIVVKPRKVGISTYIQARAFWRLEHQNDVDAVTMAHMKKNTEYIAGMQSTFHNAFDELPYPLRVEGTSATMDGVKWGPDHRSKMIVLTAGSTNRAGAGMSPSFVHFSEAAHFDDQEEVAAVMNAAPVYSEIYVESTANGEGNRFHTMWQNAMDWADAQRVLQHKPVDHDVAEHARNRWNGFVRFFWPWIMDPDYRMSCSEAEAEQIMAELDDEEKELVEEYHADVEQLKWRRRKIAGECSDQAAMDPVEYFHQEYPLTPEQAFVAQGGQVFHQPTLARMAKEARLPANDPIEHGRWLRTAPEEWELLGASPRNASWRAWQSPQPGHSYVLGVDPAEGLEHGDWSVISVFDRTDGTRLEEVARSMSKHDAAELGELAVFIAKMYNNGFIINERNGVGSTTALRISELRYWNVFFSRDPEQFKDRDNPHAFAIGFQTGMNKRQVLVRKGQHYLKDNMVLLRDREAVRQWKIYMWDDNGRPTAPDGENDDCVMADLLACHAAFMPATGIPPIGIMKDELRKERKAESPDAHFHRINRERWEKQNKQNMKRARQRAAAENRSLDLALRSRLL